MASTKEKFILHTEYCHCANNEALVVAIRFVTSWKPSKLSFILTTIMVDCSSSRKC